METTPLGQSPPLTGSASYDAGMGRVFQFGDIVVAEMLIGVADEKRVGRLVQVRKGAGAFRSDVLLIRLRDGSLASFHNVMIRRGDDERFVDAFYRSNDRTPPLVPSDIPEDAPGAEYRIAGEWPETGFIVEEPKQPEDPTQSFAMTIRQNDQGMAAARCGLNQLETLSPSPSPPCSAGADVQ